MLDNKMRILYQPILNSFLDRFLFVMPNPNVVTFLGLGFACFALIFISFNHIFFGLMFILINRICDGLDGALARKSKKTSFGGFIDIVCDFIFYSFVPLGFAISTSENYLPCVILLTSFYINGATFLALAAVLNADRSIKVIKNQKSIFYTNGLIEGTETTFFFILFCLLPDKFALLAYCLSILTFLTATQRVIFAFKTLK